MVWQQQLAQTVCSLGGHCPHAGPELARHALAVAVPSASAPVLQMMPPRPTEVQGLGRHPGEVAELRFEPGRLVLPSVPSAYVPPCDSTARTGPLLRPLGSDTSVASVA